VAATAPDYASPSIPSRLRHFSRTRGPLRVAGAGLSWAARYARGLPATELGRDPGTFVFDGVEYPYFRHRYHYTWLNERAVEVPVAQRAVADAHEGRILEAGNVLSHYGPVNHAVVDRYEPGEGVVNEDLLDFEPEERYDLIVSISTLEHVGYDERPRDPEKAARAARHLAGLLAPGGRLLATVPVGYNPGLDAAIQRAEPGFSSVSALRRVVRDRRWEQVEFESVWGAHYDHLLFEAEAVLVCTLDAPAER
jgi:SAM-dependent methyltransferase